MRSCCVILTAHVLNLSLSPGARFQITNYAIYEQSVFNRNSCFSTIRGGECSDSLEEFGFSELTNSNCLDLCTGVKGPRFKGRVVVGWLCTRTLQSPVMLLALKRRAV